MGHSGWTTKQDQGSDSFWGTGLSRMRLELRWLSFPWTFACPMKASGLSGFGSEN